MSANLGPFGVWKRKGALGPGMAAELEELGYGAIWVGGSPPGDLTEPEALLDATERVVVATGIVNMWQVPVAEVAKSHLRVAERHPGRFMLGVGVGHPEATDEYQRPLEKIESYLDELEEAGVPGQEVLLAALGPKVLRIAAERTAGAHPYLTTPSHTRTAREIMGPDALLAPEQKVVVTADEARAREMGRNEVRRYLRLGNYRRSLRREGWSETDLNDGGSDELVDALVLHGSAGQVVESARRHLDAGAGHVALHALGDDPMPHYRALAPYL